MKVLHIEDRFHPAMGYQINFFARYHRESYQFIILTSRSSRIWSPEGGGEDPAEIDRQFETQYNVRIVRLPAALDRKGKNNIWLKGLIPAILNIDPDILYVHTIESYSSLRILMNKKLVSRYRVFFDTHTLLNQFSQGMKFQLHLSLLRYLARTRVNPRGIKVFGTVPENMEILHRTYGIRKDLIRYTPIGTDLSLFRYDPVSRALLREREKIGGNDRVLLYTGKLNNRKNPHLVLEAIAKIETEIAETLHICFVGPADEEYVKARFRDRFDNERISVRRFPAVPITELYRWYSMADLAVFPNENTLSALDAQACRLPVIMESDLTNEERLKEGGLTYQKGDLADLAGKIFSMLRDPESMKSLGEKGEEYVRSRYDYRRIVNELEEELGLMGG